MAATAGAALHEIPIAAPVEKPPAVPGAVGPSPPPRPTIVVSGCAVLDTVAEFVSPVGDVGFIDERVVGVSRLPQHRPWSTPKSTVIDQKPIGAPKCPTHGSGSHQNISKAML